MPRARRLHGPVVVTLAILAILATTPARVLPEPVRLAGLLALDDSLAARWPWSGAWTWPVGSACGFLAPSPTGEPAWRLLRGFSPEERDASQPHRGVDLANGRAHDEVRAVAHGVVVCVSDHTDGSGFGSHVVMAHRLREGSIVYSVYSHLYRGSVLVREGQCVWAGEALGEVGRSGNATTDHLHFEVRLAPDPGLRWERAPAVDPLEYVGQRLPVERADTSWAAPYLAWADRAGLIEAGTPGTDALSREAWQRMLSLAARLPLMDPPRDAPSLREALIGFGVLPEREHAALRRATAWRDLRRDLVSLATIGTRLPPGPLAAGEHRSACRGRFGLEQPTRDLGALHRSVPPTVADACLLLADLAACGAPDPAPSGPPR
jgi:murein DD-endopeptidase MepM/ murein hydrolase activator NlpD